MSRSDESVIWVADGVALLDAVEGPDWHLRIDLDELDVSDSDWCVLGQLYGSWSEGLEYLTEQAKRGVGNFSLPSAQFGFTAWDEQAINGGREEYNRLTDVWHAVITHRRGSALPVQ